MKAKRPTPPNPIRARALKLANALSTIETTIEESTQTLIQLSTLRKRLDYLSALCEHSRVQLLKGEKLHDKSP